MGIKVERTGIKKEDGWLYYLDKQGHVSRAKMGRGRKASKVKPQVVAKLGVKREPGFIYFIDKDGDLAKAKMAVRGKKKSSSTKSAKKTKKKK